MAEEHHVDQERELPPELEIESGELAWLQDHGAIENGGRMYVVPEELVREVSNHL